MIYIDDKDNLSVRDQLEINQSQLAPCPSRNMDKAENKIAMFEMLQELKHRLRSPLELRCIDAIITDRQNAYMLFTDVYVQMQGDKTDHITLGTIMAKYLERMNKSNDQLLKLADLISKEEQANNIINPDDLFKQIKE